MLFTVYAEKLLRAVVHDFTLNPESVRVSKSRSISEEVFVTV